MADESTTTVGKRFEAIALENTEDHRRAYRSLLATASGLGQTISGVILYALQGAAHIRPGDAAGPR